MQLEIGKFYQNRQGKAWNILSLDGNPIHPVSAARWEEKHYRTRAFQRDGRYSPNAENDWDLVAPL